MRAKKRNTYNYNLKNGRLVVYKGTTSNINKRLSEHNSDNNKFTHMQIVGNLKTEEGAKREEQRQLGIYRRYHNGKIQNITSKIVADIYLKNKN